MKKHFNFKSIYRTALVALCLMTVGVGNAWGGNRRIYFDYSAWTDWASAGAVLKVHCWGGSVDGADYEMSAVEGESNLIYADINDGHTSLCFYRKDPNSDTWWNVTQDWGTIGTYNRFKIRNFKGESGTDEGKYCWAESGAAIRWTPGVAIDGLVDVHNPHNQAFSFTDNDGTYSVSLSAHSTYQFCIRDGSTRYTLDNNVWTSNISNYTLNTSGYDIRLTTAGAGTYTFAYNKNTHVISVTYPTVSHPNIDYCYLYGYDWEHKYLHLWSSASSIAGTTWPGTEMHNYFTIGDVKYYYYAPGDYANSKPNDNGGNQTDDLTNSEGYGQFQQYIGSSWGWRTFTVRIQLENEDATSTGTEYQDIAFNSGVLSDITCPEKTHYDFQGYYTEDGGTGTQVIDKDGHWIASVADYTDASKHWIHAGTSTTLYAKWTEHEYDLTINISPSEAGTVSPSPTKVKYVTPTDILTATPSSPAYIFKEWQYSTNVGPYDETGNDNTVKVTASQNGTLTAVFIPRYTLVGSLTDAGDPAGGMPGWTDPNADAKAFTINSISPSVNMTKACTLQPNSTYKFEIHDRKAGENYGYGEGTSVISGSQQFNTRDRTVILQTKGRGEYTFTISTITESGGKYYPTVSVSGPTSHFVTIKWADVDIDGSWNKTSRATGGTVAAVATESEKDAAIGNGQYVAEGGSIIYTATPVVGYTFGGWYNGGDWNTWFSNTNPITSSSISSAQDYEAKFVETSTAVTLANDGHGKVQINSTDQTSTTCGVTTTRQLNAVPNSGYSFSSWSKTGSDISLSATNTNPTTLTGGGSGASSQSVTANFSANNYAITLDDNHGGSGGSASVTYDATSLTSISHASFSGWNLLGYWNTDGNKVIEADGDIVANVVNYTDASHKWNYANDVTLYAHWSRTITLDKKEGSSHGSVTVTYKGTAGTPSAPSRSGYTVEGYYAETGLTTKVMNPNGTLVANVSGYTNSSSEWIHGTAATLYTKWTANEYTITLNNLEATTAGTESVTATYDATLSAITKPAKTHYDFGGYWTSSNGGSTLTTQLIDANGNWIKNVSTYTGASGDDATWVYADDITLYAKWTEHEYAITIAVTGSGSTSPVSSTTAKYVTASGDITAAPGTGYSFRDWDFSKTGEDNDVYSAGGYSSTSNPIRVLAQQDGTLTANFTANGYTVTLEDLGADEGHKGTSSVSVTYDATTNLTSSITCPQKAHYDFGGYWTSSNGGSTLTTQLIDDNGAWIAGVSGYTSASKQWIYAGDITLYAKWTETAYTITPSVSPAGAGSVNTVTDAHIVTASSTITATPANAAWIFDYWEYGEHVGCASGSGNAITVTSDMNSTITAHFKPRYELRGDIYDGSGNGGMPGWETGDAFTFNSFTALGTGEGKGCDLSCSRTLTANTTYRFQIHDRVTGNHGYATAATYIGDGDHLLFNTKDQNVMLAAIGAGTYTFRITNITEDNGKYYPTVTIERPHEVNFGQKYLDIDGTLHTGTTGGTAAATAGSALSSGDYVTYNTSVTHTATPAGGYTFAGWWSSDAFEGDRFSNDNPMTYAVTSGSNAYAKFVETSTTVTLANDGHGHVTIGGNTETSTTVGVTTTRELTAVPNDGYQFGSWEVTSGDDITLSSTSTNPTTLRGQGAGESSGQTVTANFTYRWALKAETDNWGSSEFIIGNISTNGSGDVVGYVDISLAANTNYQFTMKDMLTNEIYKNNNAAVQYMTYTNHTDWGFATDYTFNCGITTAGRGTYRFTWNVTDKTITVVYPTSYQVNYGTSVGGSVTSVKDDDNNDVPNGGYVRSGGSVVYTASANTGYTFVGWCGNDSYGDPFTTYNPWTNSSVAATSNAYAKFKSTNFVIYRSGDMSSDPRAAYDDVESYAGGTISEAIEFRMRVNRLDYWYTLCLPFTVTAVKVWDEEDGQYYDLVPYYRTGDKYYTGHYIIRTPVSTTDFDIENFDSRDRWVDPSSAAGYLPSANTPYIIQWHDSWFQDKYISFFGSTEESIPTSMNQGANTSSDETVNIYGNNCMTSGTVRDAYMLDPDYGSGGAWLREEVGTDRTVLPFECFIRANATTTAKYRVLRRDMADTPTGWDTVSETENKTTKVLIDNNIYIIRGDRMYTIQGTLVKEVE